MYCGVNMVPEAGPNNFLGLSNWAYQHLETKLHKSIQSCVLLKLLENVDITFCPRF